MRSCFWELFETFMGFPLLSKTESSPKWAAFILEQNWSRSSSKFYLWVAITCYLYKRFIKWTVVKLQIFCWWYFLFFRGEWYPDKCNFFKQLRFLIEILNILFLFRNIPLKTVCIKHVGLTLDIKLTSYSPVLPLGNELNFTLYV